MPRQPRSVVLAVVHRQILVTDIVPALEGTSGIGGPRSRCACDRTTAVSSMFEGYGYNHGLACVEVAGGGVRHYSEQTGSRRPLV